MDFYDKLLGDTLRRHFDFCIKYKGYKDCFYLSSLKKSNNAVYKIREVAKEKRYLKRIQKIMVGKYNTRVIFKNGSSFDVLFTTECSCGHRFYGAIIDLDIKDNVVNALINPCLMCRIRFFPRTIENIARKFKIMLPHIVKNDDYRPRVDYITVKGEI